MGEAPLFSCESEIVYSVDQLLFGYYLLLHWPTNVKLRYEFQKCLLISFDVILQFFYGDLFGAERPELVDDCEAGLS